MPSVSPPRSRERWCVAVGSSRASTKGGRLEEIEEIAVTGGRAAFAAIARAEAIADRVIGAIADRVIGAIADRGAFVEIRNVPIPPLLTPSSTIGCFTARVAGGSRLSRA